MQLADKLKKNLERIPFLRLTCGLTISAFYLEFDYSPLPLDNIYSQTVRKVVDLPRIHAICGYEFR